MTKGVKIFKKVVVVLLFIGLLVAVCFANYAQENQKIKSFSLSINTLVGDDFIKDQDLKALIYQQLDTFVGLKTKKVSISQIEEIAKKQEAVKNASAYFGVDGKVFLEVELKTVLVRIKPVSSEGYYLDSEGKIMKWVPSYTPRVLTITGYLERYPKYVSDLKGNKRKNRKFLLDAFEFSKFVYEDEFWSKQLVQVFINKYGDAELITLLGNQKIIFGELSNSKQKLDKLMLFYQEITKKVGWDKYKEVNLKFDKQIVCKK